MHSSLLAVFTLLMSLSASAFAANLDLAKARPPVAEKKPKEVSVHGDRRIDDYFWLREKENPGVRAYLEEENAYTDAVLAPSKGLRDTLYKEMVGRIVEDDTTAPVPYLGYLYYSRTEKGKQYARYCRRKDAPGSVEETLVDLNALATGRQYIAIGHYRVSPDGVRLAYSLDRTGYRQYEVQVLDLETKKPVAQTIGKVADLEWGAGHDVLYTITENESKRSDKLHRWDLTTGKGEVIKVEPDELFDLSLGRSLDGKYLFCSAVSKQTHEVWAWLASDRNPVLRSLLGRETDHRYSADYRDGRFYYLSNRQAANFRVLSAPEADPGKTEELIPHDPAIKREDITAFARHLVVQEREGGLPHVRIYSFERGSSARLPMPDAAYEAGPASNWAYAAAEYRFTYQSFTLPTTVYAAHFDSGALRIIKRQEVRGGYDPAKYRSERLWISARDGVKIPVAVVYRADLDRTKPQPLWLYGYGSYGVSMPIAFSSQRISLLDRGMIYVLAQIRGGGELGEEWREAGRMGRKMTTFTDFVDIAEWLVREKWTSSDRLVASGGSAGGLLMGAVINLRPELFRAVHLAVPFVDVLNTMLDATLPLTTSEYIEWGNPNVPAEYAWMRSYSPYDNLKPANYPHLLVEVSLNDSQVPYWEGAKYIAKVRTCNRGPNALLLFTNLGAGHGGSAGRYFALEEQARRYAFFLAALGIE